MRMIVILSILCLLLNILIIPFILLKTFYLIDLFYKRTGKILLSDSDLRLKEKQMKNDIFYLLIFLVIINAANIFL